MPIAKGQDYGKIDSLQRSLAKTEKSDKKVTTLVAISHEFEIFNTDSALAYANEALSLSEQDDLKKGKVNALLQKGRMLLQLVDYSNAMESFEIAIKLADKYKMTNELAIANGVIGIIYAELGDYDNSAKYNFKALELFEKVGNKQEIGVTFGNIAADMLSQKNYKKALEYMQDALNIAKAINDKPGIAQQYNNIAIVYFASYKDYSKAMSFYSKTYMVNMELGDKLQQGINLINIGFCYSRMHKNDSALLFFENAQKILKESGNPMRIANSEVALGTFYYENSDFNQSLNHSKEALKLGIEYNSKELIAESSDIIYKIYLARKDTINAFKYSLLNCQARDSLQAMQSQKTLFKLEYQYNYEKQDKERKLKQQKTNFILRFVMLGLFTGIIIIILIYSRQRIKIKNSKLEKQKMKAELNFKNKELTINLMALMKKNEVLAEISKKLLLFEKEMPNDEFRDKINKMNKELTHTSDEKIWKEFALRFNEINSGFYDILLKKYPDLSQNELRLCAYLKLNMTSKEISEITGQRILTLEGARYRIRKKLGISGSDNNLVAFLSQI